MRFEEIDKSKPVVTPRPEQRENLEISNTATFQKAIEQGKLEEAESWLLANRERSDARWLDHRSHELFVAYRAKGEWAGAKRMVELGNGPQAVEGRRAKLEEESGLLFDQI